MLLICIVRLHKKGRGLQEAVRLCSSGRLQELARTLLSIVSDVRFTAATFTDGDH